MGKVLRVLSTLLIGAVVGVAIAAAAFLAVGRERSWEMIFGPADLGPVRFETLRRATRPNDALACPRDLCEITPDVVPPVFAVDVARLRAAFALLVAAEPLITRVAGADDDLGQRFVQRSELMRYPDTVDVRFVELGEGRSTIAIYSRSQIGYRDMGVNRARVERLIAGLVARLPLVA
jgi:uncharacterized protein (DUF1499 family)